MSTTVRTLSVARFTAYQLGYQMWGLRGKRARQYAQAFYALWSHRALMQLWYEGHDDAADGRPMRYRVRGIPRPARSPTQLTLGAWRPADLAPALEVLR